VRASGADIVEAKRRYLDAAHSDQRGGQHVTGVRWWFVFMCYVAFADPMPSKRDMQDFDFKERYEDYLEDYAIWVSVAQPGGRGTVSHGSIGKYVSSVRGWYRRARRTVMGVGAAASRVSDILRGYGRLVPQPPPRERFGVAPASLALAWGALGCELMWRACTAVALIGLMRGCEVALMEGETHDDTQHLTVDDVSEAPGGLRLRMRKRKDLRVLHGKHDSVVLPNAPDGAHFDAAGLLRAWVRARRAAHGERGPLFCHHDGRGITVAELRDMVKRLMQAIGLDPSVFGAHSLRIGGATAALAAGVPPSLIRLMGRWSSDVYLIYCRMSMQAALGVGQSIMTADVQTLEEGFHEEHLELTRAEVEESTGFDWAGVAGAEGDESDA